MTRTEFQNPTPQVFQLNYKQHKGSMDVLSKHINEGHTF